MARIREIVKLMPLREKGWGSRFFLDLFLTVFVLHFKCASSLMNMSNHQQSDQINTLVCERISSLDAASLIENAYKSGLSEKETKSLLLITSDASRGANKLSGLSSILREIKFTEETQAKTDDAHSDRMTIATRRMHTQNARDISKSEVAAAALGVKTALKHIPIENRRQVLFLTDSCSVMNFFCGSDDGSSNNHIPASLLKNPHYKAMQILLKDATDNSNKIRISMAKVKSNKAETDGFFDHEATDILSSIARNKCNKNIGEIYFEDESSSSRHEMVEEPSTRRIVVPSLRCQDLEFLALSESKIDQKNVNKKPQVILKRERGARLDRCKSRMKDELGILFEK